MYVKVRLKDKGSIFHDASQDKTITGNSVVEFEKTAKVANAIRFGVLEEVKEDKVIVVEKKVETKEEDKGSDLKVPETQLGKEVEPQDQEKEPKDVEGDTLTVSPSDIKPSYSTMKKAELQALLDERGVKYGKDDTNAVLASLLEGDDNTKSVGK